MTRLELEQMTAAIGKGLAAHVPKDHAFVFIMADFAEADMGNMAYLSNAQRSEGGS